MVFIFKAGKLFSAFLRVPSRVKVKERERKREKKGDRKEERDITYYSFDRKIARALINAENRRARGRARGKLEACDRRSHRDATKVQIRSLRRTRCVIDK